MDSRTMTRDGRTMTRIYVVVSLVNRQNEGVNALHIDKLDRYEEEKNRQNPKKGRTT